MSINNVALTGRLTKDPELKYSQHGAAIARFTLAVNRQFKKDGQPDADFISCVAFNKTAENLCNFMSKGSQIGVVGNIQTGSYDKDGQRVYTTDVIANNIQFLEPKREGGQTKSPAQNYNQTAQQYAQQTPNNFGGQGQFNQNAQPPQYNNQQQNGPTIVVDDSDLPF